MIPKASQRAGGQDLATHLLNAFDNEYVELGEMRGAIADDLHGAFAEWEAIARNLTRCENYLYSLSVNPDLGQGQLTRAQYLDYAQRVEKALGLGDQPRAMVFHIKNGREHCHIVWSRIDARAGKAVHLAFDREKLMMVTREFARDHGLALPKGYEKGAEKRSQKSLYDMHQQRVSGLSKEDRMAAITAAWKRSDGPKAFVRALEEMGYMLATGNRPYVLVDLYGNMNALPRMIDDKSVRTKDIVAFLEKEYPAESLPSVDEAKKFVAAHLKAREEFALAREESKKRDALKVLQAERRQAAEAAKIAMLGRHERERAVLVREQLDARRAVKDRFVAQERKVLDARAAAKPTGLAAFLGRVTGVSFVIGQVQKYKDAQRLAAYREERAALKAAQQEERRTLAYRHELQAVDQARELRALDQVEARERKSLEIAERRELRVRQRGESGQMPALALVLKPNGRPAVPHKAKDRFKRKDREPNTERDELRGRYLEQQRAEEARRETSDESELREAFDAAAEGEEKGDARGEAQGRGDAGGQTRARRVRRRDVEIVKEVVPEVVMEPPAVVPSPEIDPHWTELPLGDTFSRAARDQREGDEQASDGRRRIRPSRSSRGPDRDRDDGKDFERER